MGFDCVYSIRHRFFPVEEASNPITRMIGYSGNRFATIVQRCICCLIGWSHSMQSPPLGKTIDTFSLSLAYIAPSSTVKAMQQGDRLPGEF